MKRLISVLAALALCAMSFAQTGGIKATVVNRAGRAPVQGAKVELFSNGESIAHQNADVLGRFCFEGIADGSYMLTMKAEGFLSAQVNVIVEKGLMRDLVFVTLSPVTLAKDSPDEDNFAEQDFQDSGYSDAPTILFSNDVYSELAGFGFSAIRFKNRGYNSETQDVYLAGVKLNDAITGYSPFSLWSGLNEATRSKESTLGVESSQYGVGGINGVTNIMATPSSVRPGWRSSVLTNSSTYRLRLMLTYGSGQKDNGISYAFNVSARLGGNDWTKGVFYRNFAYYAGIEKNWGDIHRLSLVTLASPGQRGAANASTQEVYDMMGDNMYNSNWGYQNGKVRNARVRNTFEPITFLKYNYTPSDKLSLGATLLWRTGYNGYSALDWYDAADPRPDYYRNLPSYFSMVDEDYDRNSEEKAAWAAEMWNPRIASYSKYQHIDWDRMYNVNYNSADGRSKYAQEERHVDQNDLHAVFNAHYVPSGNFTIDGGINLRLNRTENYKKMKDLLGGKYYLNIDSFAERDFAANEAKVQNDLDYWVANNRQAEKVVTGGKYGYDYLSQVRDARVWASGAYSAGGFRALLAGSIGYNTFWREGLVRKGLFAGTWDDGSDIIIDGVNLTQESNGQTSKGKSAVSGFVIGSVKTNLSYTFVGGHRIFADAGYFVDAPSFNNSFISPRTRNTLVSGLKPIKTFSGDLNYQYSGNGIDARVTAYYTTIKDQSDVMSFYDDSQHSFTNFAMTGIDQRHLGVEIGVRVPIIDNLTLSGAFSWGDHIYTSVPKMVQTIDNSAEVIREDDVPYWNRTPIFSKVKDPVTGTEVYDIDADDNPIVKGYKNHYVPSTPQICAELALNYNINNWFLELNGQYFDKSYIDMNPLYRTTFACAGPDGVITPQEIEYMTEQEKFAPAFLLNLSIGKTWYIKNRQLGFSLNGNNLTNNRNVKTGGYEQTRLVTGAKHDVYKRFDTKYFYMCGINYMLNIYFRF